MFSKGKRFVTSTSNGPPVGLYNPVLDGLKGRRPATFYKSERWNGKESNETDSSFSFKTPQKEYFATCGSVPASKRASGRGSGKSRNPACDAAELTGAFNRQLVLEYEETITRLQLQLEQCEARESDVTRELNVTVVELRERLQQTRDEFREVSKYCEESIKEKLEALIENLKTLTNERDVLAEKYSHAELLLKTQSDKVDSLQDKICDLESHLREVETLCCKQAADLKSREVVLLDQLADANNMSDQHYSALKSMTTKCMEFEEELETETKMFKQSQNVLKAELNSLKNGFNQKLEEIDMLKQSNRDLRTELAATKSTSEMQLEQLHKRLHDSEGNKQLASQVKQLEQENKELQESSKKWENSYILLKEKYQPFEQQIEHLSASNRGLMTESQFASSEVARISSQYARLVGHQNHKQKIHHVQRLVEENQSLKKELMKLREEVSRYHKSGKSTAVSKMGVDKNKPLSVINI